MLNGVKQGAIISLILFTIHIDNLWVELKVKTLVSYSLYDNHYMSILAYVDDIKLIYPMDSTICLRFVTNLHMVMILFLTVKNLWQLSMVLK